MPSPGISFGDLLVFVVVLMIVAVFLIVVRSFVKRVTSLFGLAFPSSRELSGAAERYLNTS